MLDLQPPSSDAREMRVQGWLWLREEQLERPLERSIMPIELLHLQGFPARDPLLAKALQGLTEQEVVIGAGNAMSVPVIGAVLADVFVKTLVGRLDVAMEVSDSEDLEDDLGVETSFPRFKCGCWLHLRRLPDGPGGRLGGVGVHSGRRSEKLLLGRDARRASGLLMEAEREGSSVVSRVHAEILPGRQPGEAFLRDLASTNGSWVLGKGKVSPEDVEGEVLASGDEISLGVDPGSWQGGPDPSDFRFLFRIEMPSPKRRRTGGTADRPAVQPDLPQPPPAASPRTLAVAATKDLPSAAETIAALEELEKVNSAQPTLRNRTLRGIGVSGEARGPPVPAAATVEGQELEEMLWKASREAEVRFFMSYQSLARRGRDGSVPGFRRWLDDLKLDGYAKQALVWAEEMGASDLEEVLENLEDFMEKIGLGEKLEDEEDMEAFYAKAAAAAEQIQVTNRPSLHLNSSEREDLWHFWSLRRPGVELYRAFDARVAELAEPAEPAAAAGTGSLEERLSTELRARLEGDLQYLVVMREYHALHLPRLPSLESSNGTWTFCGGSEEWLRRADGAAAPVPLPPLERAVKRTMQEAILGGQPRGARFLETYLAMERFHPEDLPDSPCEVVNVSKQAVLQAVRAVAGAAGLPDWNRSFDDAPVPLAITPESLQNRSEVVKQVRRYFDLMANTRVAQADKYFGHVLFGLLLSRVCQRFDLLQEAQLLSSDLESQRALLESQLSPLPAEQVQSRLENRLLEAFVQRLGSQGMADHLVLQPEQLLAVRRHTDHIFGRGLREEIFVPLSRASRLGAQQGLRAAGPGLCADQLEQSAVEGRLRMLSLNAMAAERFLKAAASMRRSDWSTLLTHNSRAKNQGLAWHGLVFGALLGQHELAQRPGGEKRSRSRVGEAAWVSPLALKTKKLKREWHGTGLFHFHSCDY
ncbi:FHA domain-containing protein [Durusdinium trenchii]|uniref:FHA domain-containing protein n=1 Tax=Durusdinium trenchii TaxID=1381693 RepID=A0ABP0LXD6_9DINO